MSVTFQTADAAGLLRRFDAALTQAEVKGRILTWRKHEDARHYTHTSAQWQGQAYFSTLVGADGLIFHIVRSTARPVSVAAYAFYHGHLVETFLNHFDREFNAATSTSLPSEGDRCS